MLVPCVALLQQEPNTNLGMWGDKKFCSVFQNGFQAAQQMAMQGCEWQPSDASATTALLRSEAVVSCIGKVTGAVSVYSSQHRAKDTQAFEPGLLERKAPSTRQGKSCKPTRRALRALAVRSIKTKQARQSKSVVTLRAKASQGKLVLRPKQAGCWPHRSHDVWRVGASLQLCARCGHYAMVRRSPGLGAACLSRPRHAQAKTQLGKMTQGKHPRTGGWLGARHRR